MKLSYIIGKGGIQMEILAVCLIATLPLVMFTVFLVVHHEFLSAIVAAMWSAVLIALLAKWTICCLILLGLAVIFTILAMHITPMR